MEFRRKIIFCFATFLLLIQLAYGINHESSFSLLRGWFAPGNGFQYKLTSKAMDFNQASKECEGWGGSLAQHGLRDQFFYPTIAEKFLMPVWIGLRLRKAEGEYYWEDERPLNRGWNNAWAFLQPSQEPDEDCVIMSSEPCEEYFRGLDDVQCDEIKFGLCERRLGNTHQHKYTTINGTTYFVITAETRYGLAKKDCQSFGGKLAEKPVTNPTLAAKIVDGLYNDMDLHRLNSWVGISDVEREGDLNLESKSELAYADINWLSDYNSERMDCGSFNPQIEGKILLEPCQTMKTILCEMPEIETGHKLTTSCLPKMEECDLGSNFRKINGHCHSFLNEDRGREKRPFKRMLPPAYDDGVETPRGGAPTRLPSPRAITTALNESVEPPSLFASHQMPLWGQFLAHDLTKLGELKDKNGGLLLPCPCGDTHPECFNIDVPEGDPVREQIGCYSFLRAEPVPDINCDTKIRAQENRVTSYIDASNVYGSNQLFASNLKRENGLLMAGHFTNTHYEQLPLGTQVRSEMQTQFECEAIHFDFTHLPCMAGGDIRVNEQAALASGHTMWMRKHNQIAGILQSMNPHWDSEKLYEVTRSIIAAIHQQISFNEFFPILLGEANMKRFGLKLTKKGYYYGYDSSYDSTIDISFATAAFRLGHTLINGLLTRPRPDYSEDPDASTIDLSSRFFDPVPLFDHFGMGSVLRGMVADHAMHYDTQFTNALTNHLFAKAGEFGRDLPAINVQRGRDHGIPSYMKHRRFCGLSTTTNCEEMEDIPMVARRKLCNLYNSTEDIDLFVGGIAEVPRDSQSGVPGPTFACIIAYQARDLRKGDLFWFENGGAEAKFSNSQLKAIKKVSLSRIICDVGENISTIQPKAMLQHTLPGNERIPCSELPRIDLSPFEEIDSLYVATTSNDGNDEEDYEWTEWFPYTISNRKKLPLKPAPVLLRHLRVYRPDDVCTNILGAETRRVNKFLQVRYKCYPGAIKATDFPPVDAEEVYWTSWSDQASPSAPHFDDDEDISGSGSCLYPVAIQAQTVAGIPARETGDVFETFSPTQGLLCKGVHQTSQRCHDYRIRFLCLKD